MSTYSKPHLTFQQQLALIKSRGAICPDDDMAIRLLKSVGYYNLTGYLYPFRRPDPSGHGRQDQFVSGTNIARVGELVEFDRRLRTCLLSGLQLVEVGLRARIAYILGRRDPFGHVDDRQLDSRACARTYTRGSRRDTAFNWWIIEYDRLQDRARNEPFVAYNLAKYGRPLPIWIAVEFLDFGALVNLYQLMQYSDRQDVAAAAGLTRERTLRSWLKSLNTMRNICAHNSRLWNRVLMVRPTLSPPDLPRRLSHLGVLSNDKPYPILAITAHLTDQLNPDAKWSQEMADTIRAFPRIPGRSMSEMGVPANWNRLAIWK